MGVAGRRLLVASLLIGWPFVARGFEVTPAWGGRFVPGEPTELGVQITSARGGAIRLRVEGTAGTIERDVVAEAGRAATIALPAQPGVDGQLDVSILGPDGERQARQVVLVPRPARFPAAVADGALLPAGDQERILVQGRELPRTAAGYGPIASLTLRANALVGLDDSQTSALSEYLAGCGALAIPDADPGLVAAVRATAGCGGRTVGTGGARLDQVPPRPAAERLAAALPGGDDSGTLWLLLLPYLVIVAGVAVSPRRLGAWVIALPPTAALAYAAAIPQTVPPASAVTWAEAGAGDGQPRFVTLLRAQGAGGESAPIALPARGVLAMPATGAGVVRLDTDGGQHLSRPVDLLSHTDYRLQGAARLPFRLEAVAAQGAALRVRSAGGGASPGGWLVRSGRASAFPALEPGQSRALDGEPVADAPPPVPLDSATTGILLPLPAPLPAGLDGIVRGAGWLLVRLPGEVR